jgi:hypothetical protein
MKQLFILIAAITLCYTVAVTADEVPLYAGQNINVGSVTVVNTDDWLYVTYLVTESDWMLVETHLAVENDSADIPQTRKRNNPIPGQFEFSMEHNPPVLHYTYVVNISQLDPELYIAAHAVVQKLGESCIDFDGETSPGVPEYNEKDEVQSVATPSGNVGFYMVSSDPLVGLTVGDWADLTPVVDEYPVVAEEDTTPPYEDIVAFTVNDTQFGGTDPYRDDYVRDDKGTGAGGKLLTDPQDTSQTPLLWHAYSQFLAIGIDLTGINNLQSLSLVGVDLDHSELWHFQYFDENDRLINEINVGPGVTSTGDGVAFPVNYFNPSIKKLIVWGEQNQGRREVIGFALDNICISAVVQDETAWGDGSEGMRFSDRSWGTYFVYDAGSELKATPDF